MMGILYIAKITDIGEEENGFQELTNLKPRGLHLQLCKNFVAT